MNQNDNFLKIINLFWIIITFIPFFNGLGFIYAGWRVNETKWIDEGIIYMIPFIFLSFTILNETIVYLAFLLLIIGIIRAFMIVKPFLKKLEEKDHNNNLNSTQNNNVITTVETNTEPLDKVIDVNNATIQDLEKIPIIDKNRLEKIIELRRQGYVFYSIDDLSQKLNLNQSEIKDIEKYLKINKVSNSRRLDI